VDSRFPKRYWRSYHGDEDVVARLLINTGNGVPTVCELNLGVNRFGRHPDSEFPIDHPTISATHCEMILTAQGVLLRDCDSTNGTFLDDEPVKQASLRPGQTVRLGDVTILVETTDARIAIPDLDSPLPIPPIVLPDGTILCRRHPQSRATHRCTHCHEVLCDACVHRMRREGGKTLKLCALCSHACEPIAPTKRKKKSWLGLLNKTIKLPFLRNKKDN
jgi:pSer/pThr/pTyr-binding forkhead associated (FHA) protein